MSNFVHLHLHSEFSVYDGTCRVPELINKAIENNSHSLAITDDMAMFGAVRLVEKSEKAKIKPILGAEVTVSSKNDKEEDGHIVLLVESKEGYENLSKLISKAQVENKNHKTSKAAIKSEWLNKKNTKGLFCLTGGYNGYINIALDKQKNSAITREATDRLEYLQKVFQDNLAVELTRCSRPQEEDQLHSMVRLAYEMSIPVLATNDVRFINRSDFENHDIRQMISKGENVIQYERERKYSPEQYMKSEEDMYKLFDDIPQAVDNAIAVAKRCNYRMELGKNFLPRFTAPEGYQHYPYVNDLDPKAMNIHLENCYQKWKSDNLSEEEIFGLLDESKLLISESWYGFDKRWNTIVEYYQGEGLSDLEIAEKKKEYEERIITELEIVTGMGFPGYYLIVKDFIQWAKENGIPVGPGRGSGAGSLVAYVTDITDLDPIPYDLLFERFLNPERVSMPDFDIDFCMDRREEVIDYVSHRYGKDRVSQIATMGTMAARMVVKDVVRAMGLNYNVGERLSKMIPEELGITLSKSLDISEEMNQEYHSDEEVKEIIDRGIALEGLTRSIGKHAGGVLISPDDITKFTPLYVEGEDKIPVSQYDKNDVESAGLVKFDFLGLRTLTIINDAVKHINESVEGFDIRNIPLKDDETFNMIKTAKTTAIFQLESSGMQGVVKRLKPSCFEDLIALVALYRPGPLQSGMVDDFIDRKHGLQPISYPHPDYQLDSLKPVLEPTYGIIVYQEQVMQIAQVMAGYSLGQADLLRRAMGKKKPEEMAKQRQGFLEGSVKNGIDAELAGNVFDLVEKFAGYGFNKSHSAGYGLLTYQTAFLKTHYPVQFMSAVLSSEADNQDKVIHLLGEVKRMGLKILNPDINKSDSDFKPIPEKNSILFGLEGIKGVGTSAIHEIIKERSENGEFTSLENMIERMDGKRITTAIYKSLIGAGAFDQFSNERNVMQYRAELIAKIEADFPKKYKSYITYKEKYNKALENDLSTGKKSAERLKPHHWPPCIKTDVDENGNDIYEEIIVKGTAKRHDILLLERNALGTFISQHPFSLVEEESKRYSTHSLREVVEINPEDIRQEKVNTNVRVSGILSNVSTKTKNKFSIMTIKLDDGHSTMDVRLFSREFNKYKNMLEGALFQPILISGKAKIDKYNDSITIDVDSIESYNNIRDNFARAICIIRKSTDDKPLKPLSENVYDTLNEFSNGYSAVLIQDMYPNGEFKTYPLKTHRVSIRDELILKLNDMASTESISNIKVLGAIDKNDRMKLDAQISRIVNANSTNNKLFNILKADPEMVKNAIKERKEERDKLFESLSP